jgi:hypothetical protein
MCSPEAAGPRSAHRVTCWGAAAPRAVGWSSSPSRTTRAPDTASPRVRGRCARPTRRAPQPVGEDRPAGRRSTRSKAA